MRKILTGALLATLLSVAPLHAAYAADGLTAYFDGRTTPTALAETGIDPLEHSDASIVYRGGKYIAFYRDALNGKFAIRRAESTGPNGPWTVNGHVVIGGQNGARGCGGAYAPDVVVDQFGNLHMVYEANPRNGNYTAAFCESPQDSNQYVAIAKSTDGGFTWTNHRKLAWRSIGTNGANIGTPDLSIIPNNKIVVSWHQNSGNAVEGGTPLFRESRTWPYGDPGVITSNNAGALKRQIFNWKGTSTPVTSTNGFYDFGAGVGRADTILIGSIYYIVVEGFDVTTQCNTSMRAGVVLGRSLSPDGPWDTNPGLLDPDGLISRTYCNNDMPSFHPNVTSSGTRYRMMITNNVGNGTGSLAYRQFVDG